MFTNRSDELIEQHVRQIGSGQGRPETGSQLWSDVHRPHRRTVGEPGDGRTIKIFIAPSQYG